MSSKIKMPTFFISHGGGPWPWLDGPYRDSYRLLEQSLKELPNNLPQKPNAILIISGHWETEKFSIMTHAQPPMIYDYSGFPAHTYQIKYPAKGMPTLALNVQSMLDKIGIPILLDTVRGYDHGTFTPLAVSFPNADVPVVQLSMRADYDADAHIKVGRALAPLREQGVLIIGSGLSYHNLRMFDQRAAKPSHEFDAWLQQTLIHSDPLERRAKLLEWERAPSARIAHPQEDHLLPLMIAVGAAEEDLCQMCYHEDNFMGGIAVSSFRFG